MTCPRYLSRIPDGDYIAVANPDEIDRYIDSLTAESRFGRVAKPGTTDILIDQLGVIGTVKEAFREALGATYALLLPAGQKPRSAGDRAFALAALAEARVRLLLIIDSQLPDTARQLHGQITMDVLTEMLRTRDFQQMRRGLSAVEHSLQEITGRTMEQLAASLSAENAAKTRRLRIGIPLLTGYGLLLEDALAEWDRRWNKAQQIVPSVGRMETLLAELPGSVSLHITSHLAKSLGDLFSQCTYEHFAAKTELFRTHVDDLALIAQEMAFVLDDRVRPFATAENFITICHAAGGLPQDDKIDCSRFAEISAPVNARIGAAAGLRPRQLRGIYAKAASKAPK